MTFAIAAKSGTGFAAGNRADTHGQHGRQRSGCNRPMAGSPQFAKSRNGPGCDWFQVKRRYSLVTRIRLSASSFPPYGRTAINISDVPGRPATR